MNISLFSADRICLVNIDKTTGIFRRYKYSYILNIVGNVASFHPATNSGVTPLLSPETDLKDVVPKKKVETRFT